MKHLRVGALSLALAATFSSQASAADLTIEVENLTNGIYFTPFIVAAHPAGNNIFTTGSAASASLEALAEGGDITGVHADLTAVSANIFPPALGDGQPTTGLTFPGTKTTSIQITNAAENTHLSVASMLLPTNDAFVGLNAWKIPSEPGTYTINLNAYDAGTEANTELLSGDADVSIPTPPPLRIQDGETHSYRDTGGINGTGVASADHNSNVHIHRGNLGDAEQTGGTSDLDSRVHRWLNPVARITVTVN